MLLSLFAVVGKAAINIGAQVFVSLLVVFCGYTQKWNRWTIRLHVTIKGCLYI